MGAMWEGSIRRGRGGWRRVGRGCGWAAGGERLFFSVLFLQKINLVYYIEEISREAVFFIFLTRRYIHCTIYCIYRGIIIASSGSGSARIL